MATITLNINDDVVEEVMDAFETLQPIPLIGDPPIPQYSRPQWAKRGIKKLVIKLVKRCRNQKEIEGISVEEFNEDDIN